MRRRQLFVYLAALAFALPARAQPNRVYRIGFLSFSGRYLRAFRDGLHQFGWVADRNVTIIFRSADGGRERLRENARELAALELDVVVTVGGPPAAEMSAASRSIPIVFTLISDPVGTGLVSNLARPGGNVTGFTTFGDPAIGGKWLQLLKEIAPQLTRALVITEAENAPNRVLRDTIAALAPSLGIGVVTAEVRRVADYEPQIDPFAREPRGGLIVVPNAVANNNQEAIHALAARYRLPAVYGYPFFAKSGGLISYGSDPAAQLPEAARYVDRILRGEKPGDLPVQQPTKFSLVVNLKTAEALGITIPSAILARADEVIE